jgi:signal transduction histidine kinase
MSQRFEESVADISTARSESSLGETSAIPDSPLNLQLQELERENDAMRRALAIVSHEMKTPLTSIVAFCDLLLRNRENQLNSRAMGQLTSICRNAGRLTEIIEDLGQVVLLGSQGGLSITPSSFDAAALIEETATSIQPVLDMAGQTLIVHPPPTGSMIQADKSRLHQVLENLLTNASKFSPPSSHIDIAAELDDSRLYIQVVDRGIGIPKEEVSKVFDYFYRANTGAGNRASGLGIGLFITREIVHAHGGNLSIKSEIGRGTTVSFAIPRNPDSDQQTK